jgi:hypothetical protein
MRKKGNPTTSELKNRMLRKIPPHLFFTRSRDSDRSPGDREDFLSDDLAFFSVDLVFFSADLAFFSADRDFFSEERDRLETETSFSLLRDRDLKHTKLSR